MDPSMYLQYNQPNGLPQESKLVTYMNRSATTPTRSLNQAMGNLSLESSPTSIRKVQQVQQQVPQAMISEFVPMTYYPQPMMPESPGSSSPLGGMQPAPQVLQENVGGTTYFYATTASEPPLAPTVPLKSSSALVYYIDAANALHLRMHYISGSESCMSGPIGSIPSPYATHMYTLMPAPIVPMNVKQSGIEGLASTFFTPEVVRSEIYCRNRDSLLGPDLRHYPDLPECIECYTDLSPLESPAPHSSATSFRATHRSTGEHFALRRIHSYNKLPPNRFRVWKQINHPNIVPLQDYFMTQAFGDNSVVLVYQYHPGAKNVLDQHFPGTRTSPSNEANSYPDPFSSDPDAPRPYTHQKNAMLRAAASGTLLPEAVLWSFVIQVSGALRVIHNSGLACRALDPSKIIMNGCRARISWIGIPDLGQPNGYDIVQAQQEDLTSLGRLTLAVACRTLHCDNIQASLDMVSRTYSSDFKNFLLYLLTPTSHRNVNDLMPLIGGRFYTQVDALQLRSDVLENEFAREMDNGRLLRIMVKLGVINERPELTMDQAWAETGDRYLLKLFRDHLFHSVSHNGKPWLDHAHITHCLNQLDGGSQDKVELMSRDEQSILVVTFAELKHCFEQAFNQLVANADEP